MPVPVVEFDGVDLALGGKPVLHALTLEVRAGETLVLLGRSGAGKSSALRLVNRLLSPDRGEVRVSGRPTDGWDPIRLRRGIGYMIQEVGLFPHMTVADNVGVVPRLLAWPDARVSARIEEMLSLVGLLASGIADRHPGELSGGQRQRVGIARALAGDPPLLLCDEPFGALDPVTRGQLQEEFRSLSRRLGKTLLFVTHDVNEARLLGDRIGLLSDGKLAFVDSPAAFDTSDQPEVRAFRGEAGP